MSVNKLKFTLDNLIYNCVVKEDEDLEFILPRRTPSKATYTSKTRQEKSVILSATEQIKIKVFVTVRTRKVPKIIIKGEDRYVKIAYATKLSLEPNSQTIISFTTTNGGTNWLVSQENYYISNVPEPPTNIVTSVNGQTGQVIIDATNINLKQNPGQPIITVQEQFEKVEQQIITLEETVVSDVTGDIVKILPDMIKIEMSDAEITAPKI